MARIRLKTSLFAAKRASAHEYFHTPGRGTATTIVDVVGDITLYNSPEVRKVLLGLIKEKHCAARMIVETSAKRSDIHR